MKESDLKKALLERSEFTSPGGLASAAGINRPFVDRYINSKTESSEKKDILFEMLTPGISVEKFLAALDFIEAYEKERIEKEQFL